MDGYELTDEVEVVAVADPVAAARARYVEQYGIPQQYESVEEMLENAQPDIVSVCTWHLLHPAPTIAAAQAGVKAVICEKPMAIGMEAADSMVDACDASGTKLIISHQRRFTPGWEKARQLIREGAIGTPLFVTNKVADGLTNWGTHSIDGSRFVLDNPKASWVMGSVERRTDRYERDTAVEDACMGLVQFDGDLQLFIQSDLKREARGGRPFSNTRKRRIHGSHRTERPLAYDQPRWLAGSRNRITRGSKSHWRLYQCSPIRELLAWIEGDIDEHRNAGAIARDTVEIMMALYESARRNAVVNLPLDERSYPLERMIEEGKLPVEIQGRYDIRSFLKWDGIDEEKYKALSAQGMGHHQIMRQLHEEMQG